jgi:hypothetical protein
MSLHESLSGPLCYNVNTISTMSLMVMVSGIVYWVDSLVVHGWGTRGSLSMNCSSGIGLSVIYRYGSSHLVTSLLRRTIPITRTLHKHICTLRAGPSEIGYLCGRFCFYSSPPLSTKCEGLVFTVFVFYFSRPRTTIISRLRLGFPGVVQDELEGTHEYSEFEGAQRRVKTNNGRTWTYKHRTQPLADAGLWCGRTGIFQWSKPHIVGDIVFGNGENWLVRK